MTELDPADPFDQLLLGAMRKASVPVADGVLADIIDNGVWLELRAVLAGQPQVPGAVGRWLDSLPTGRKIIVPAVTSDRLAGMLARRGFTLRRWWDQRLGMFDPGAWIREPS